MLIAHSIFITVPHGASQSLRLGRFIVLYVGNTGTGTGHGQADSGCGIRAR